MLPSLNLKMSVLVNRGFSKKIKSRMANSVDPDETARYGPSYQDQHCLQKCVLALMDGRVKGNGCTFREGNSVKIEFTPS